MKKEVMMCDGCHKELAADVAKVCMVGGIRVMRPLPHGRATTGKINGQAHIALCSPECASEWVQRMFAEPSDAEMVAKVVRP